VNLNVAKLYRECGGICQFCGIETVLPASGDDRWNSRRDLATEEHIIPRALGGATGPTTLACQGCNNGPLSLIDTWAARIGGVIA
jgi:hypothetical protein